MDGILSPAPTLTFLIGGLGAGKTELALNLALSYAETHGSGRVHLVDLDVVNPFFRVRKVCDELTRHGVNVVMPDAKVRAGDLPALPAAAWGAFEAPQEWTVVDIGGGELGLRPLGRIREIASCRPGNVYFVVNPFRPGYRTLEDMEKNFRHLQTLSALSVTQLVANPHLVHETTLENFQEGLAQIRILSERVGLPVAFAMAAEEIADEARSCAAMPLLTVRRFWRTPWKFGLGADAGSGDPVLDAAAKTVRFGAWQKPGI